MSSIYGVDNKEIYRMDLHTAASIGYKERLRAILKSPGDKSLINSQNSGGWTPLMYAACCADLKIVLLLLEEGADANLKNRHGQTALMLATKYGNTDVANLLIDNGADVSDIDLRGWPPLFHASTFGYRSLVQLLVKKGAQINFSDQEFGLTALILASTAGHVMIVKELLNCGADPSLTLKSGETARCLAIREGHTKVTEVIDAHMLLKGNSVAPNTEVPRIQQQQSNDVFDVLESLNLGKYYPIFESHEIDPSQFWLLTEDNLKEIGIDLLGPRKKILSAIGRFHYNMSCHHQTEEHSCANKLLLSNQNLMSQMNQLSKLLSQEQQNKEVAENDLARSIQTLQFLVERINTSLRLRSSVLDQLKYTHLSLGRVLSKGTWPIAAPKIQIKEMMDSVGDLINSLFVEHSSLYEDISLQMHNTKLNQENCQM